MSTIKIEKSGAVFRLRAAQLLAAFSLWINRSLGRARSAKLLHFVAACPSIGGCFRREGCRGEALHQSTDLPPVVAVIKILAGRTATEMIMLRLARTIGGYDHGTSCVHRTTLFLWFLSDQNDEVCLHPARKKATLAAT